MKNPIYIVPYDFSEISFDSLCLAIDVAKKNNGSVMVIHIVSKKSSRAEMLEKMKLEICKFSDDDQKLINTRVIVGDIYTDIALASEILGAQLIIMGTKGAQGMQKLFGSHALRLVNSTSTPFIITQKTDRKAEFNTIVLPFSFTKESLQITNFAKNISLQFNSKIHLVGYHSNDEWLGKQAKQNQMIIHRFLDDYSVPHEIVNLPKGSSFQTELMSYANKVNADLIAIAHYNESILPSPNTLVQVLIENESKIPVLTVNAEELTVTSNYSFMTV